MFKKILDAHIDTDKAVSYAQRQQSVDGGYPGMRPDPVASMYCLKILSKFDEKPRYSSTLNWVQSLQTGKRGFGETTGQNSWDYTTYHGSEMHKQLGLRPRFEKEFVHFVSAHQNKDGGFSSNFEAESNIRSTVYWAHSLLNFGYTNLINLNVGNYLGRFLHRAQNLNLFVLYSIFLLQKKLNLLIPKEGKLIQQCLSHVENSEMVDLSVVYYAKKILDVMEVHYKIDSVFDVPSSPQDCFMILELTDTATKHKQFLDYVRQLELPQGGFFNDKEQNLLTAYECIQSLNILDEKIRNQDLGSTWIKNCQNPDGGFGNVPGSPSRTIMSFRALRCLRLLNRSPEYPIKPFLDRHSFLLNPYDAFYGIYGYREINEVPLNYRAVAKKMLTLLDKGGGFAHDKGGHPEMYSTYRCVGALSIIHKLLKEKKIPHLDWMRSINEKVCRWIFSCEHPEGGFSWIPNESPYVQPTYLALHCLYELQVAPKSLEKHRKWIANCQNKDGGFNGGERGTPSGTLYLYYMLASLLILNSFERKQKLDEHLGL